ncbi:hypothetical protein [Paenibacillus zanthoxyli]|uniref:hypothetical protein n=1 Tax=Paenibacillus zanthoxyli TaxID=369399 RepID=UPI000471AAC9|nr:hypothetical protein [Paenibacillus zanthoxyli]
MIEIYTKEWKTVGARLAEAMRDGKITVEQTCAAIIPVLDLLRKVFPDEAEFPARQGEYYHLDGQLRRAGRAYQMALELDPPLALTEREAAVIRRYCPLLLTTEAECFPLKDIVAIHHPTRPLIGYHLFWEDDFDFPDDYEPCDHEEIWVEYDPDKETVTQVMTFFHSSVISSEEAVREAREQGERPIIRIEWGKHGSLLKGWETINIPMKNMTMQDWMRQTYEHVKAGGRLPEHPLKRFWPRGFEGSYESYIDFSVLVDPLLYLERKPLMFKSLDANAILFTQAIPYNFHPKMEWPDRFARALLD